jgi:transcription elongation factor Elf1
MPMQGSVVQYVLCPVCGDPVAGRLPARGGERTLTCAHCRNSFPFTQQDVRSGVVVYDEEAQRWKLGNPPDDSH